MTLSTLIRYLTLDFNFEGLKPLLRCVDFDSFFVDDDGFVQPFDDDLDVWDKLVVFEFFFLFFGFQNSLVFSFFIVVGFSGFLHCALFAVKEVLLDHHDFVYLPQVLIVLQ